MSRTLEGGIGHVHGSGQRRVERLEALSVLVLLGERIEASLRLVDLRARRTVDACLVGAVDHVLADHDQRAAGGQVIDRAAILGRIDDGRGIGGKAAQILRHGGVLVDRLGILEERLHRHGRGELAGVDQRRERLEDARVQGIVEVRRGQKARDAVQRFVVDEDRAEQGLLGFQVMRGLAEGNRLLGAGGFAKFFSEEDCGICHEGRAIRFQASSRGGTCVQG